MQVAGVACRRVPFQGPNSRVFSVREQGAVSPEVDFDTQGK